MIVLKLLRRFRCYKRFLALADSYFLRAVPLNLTDTFNVLQTAFNHAQITLIPAFDFDNREQFCL